MVMEMFPGLPKLLAFEHEVSLEGFTTAVDLESQGADDGVVHVDGLDDADAVQGSRRPPTLGELVEFVSERSEYFKATRLAVYELDFTSSGLSDGDVPALEGLLQLLPNCSVVNMKGCHLHDSGIDMLAEMAKKCDYRVRFVVGVTPAVRSEQRLRRHLARPQHELVCLPLRSAQCSVRAFLFHLAHTLGEVDADAQLEQFSVSQLHQDSLSAKAARCLIKSFPALKTKLT